MSTRDVNVTKGKQGFQEVPRHESAVADLSSVTPDQDQRLLDRRDEWLDHLEALDEEAMLIAEALIADKVLANHPEAKRLTSLRISVAPAAADDPLDSGFRVKPYSYSVQNSNYMDVSSTKVWEGDDDEELLTEAANMLSERNRQHIWDTGRGPMGGPGYRDIDLAKKIDEDNADNLGAARIEINTAIIGAKNEIHRADAALAARRLQALGVRETQYAVLSTTEWGTESHRIRVLDVKLDEKCELSEAEALTRAHDVLSLSLSPTTLHAIGSHQVGAGPSILDRYDTYYADGSGD